MRNRLLIFAIAILATIASTEIALANSVTLEGYLDATGPHTEDIYLFHIGGASSSIVTFDVLANERGLYDPSTGTIPLYDFFGNGIGNDLLDTVVSISTSGGLFVGVSDDSSLDPTDAGNFGGFNVYGGSDGSMSILDSMIRTTLDPGDYFLRIQAIDSTSGHYRLTMTADQDVLSVPEPSTLLLLGSGLIGLAGFRRKFKI